MGNHLRFFDPLERRILLDGSIEIRVNQIGYLPEDQKIAMVMSNGDLDGQTVDVVSSDGTTQAHLKIGRDRGAYGAWGDLYEVDLSKLSDNPNGACRYHLQRGAAHSAEFNVGQNIYQPLVALTLGFFQVQRSSDANAKDHAPSHLTDGTAMGGPMKGQHVDVSGGWYDAGDYLKFTLPGAFVTMIMLTAYDDHPNLFDNKLGALPQVLAETKIEMDWFTKMWDAKSQALYYQVGDSKDHDDYGWRLPDDDDKQHPNRPVFACDAGKGANLAGKMAASLALAAKLWGDPKHPWYDDALAAKYREAATSLYEFGKSHPATQATTNDFYEESSWQDDMALAGAEMYRLTGERKYLDDAEKWANQVGSQYSLDYSDMNSLACYRIAGADPSFKANAIGALKHDLQGFAKNSTANQWGASQSKFEWGSGEQMAGAALEAMWYQQLTGDAQFRPMATRQRDYLLGANPWGVCMVNGAGTVWPHHPHHQIADIKKIELAGFWAEGPVAKKIFSDEHIKLRVRPDPFATFQTGGAVYHDDTEDYTTNEPTLDMNATGLAMTAWFADVPHSTTRP